jgi:hypothetical protein
LSKASVYNHLGENTKTLKGLLIFFVGLGGKPHLARKNNHHTLTLEIKNSSPEVVCLSQQSAFCR